MLMLELFSGSKILSKTFTQHGWDTVTIDNNPDLKADICDNAYNYLSDESIKSICNGKIPEVIWASPDCQTYSVAAITKHRYQTIEGHLKPKTEYGKFCDEGNTKLVNYFKHYNGLYFIENPRGGLRKTSFMEDLPRYTITYCQYGDFRQKPTDIWTNHPNPKFKPPCEPNSPCHQSAPRGSRCGTQSLKHSFERAKLPLEFCEHIVCICEEYYNLR